MATGDTERKTNGKPRVGDGTPGPGRPKGVANKVTLKREKAIAASGLTPLDYMLSVLRDEDNALDVRLDAAKCAAPYCHPRLATITHNGPDGGPMVFVLSKEDVAL